MAIETAEQIRARTQASAPQETPIAWRHDPEYERAVNLVNTNLAKLKAGRTTSEQRLNEDVTTATRTAGQAHESNLSALQNKLANQGIGYSGVNVQEQGKLGQNYQNTIAALTQHKQRGLEDIATETADKESTYNDILQQAEIGKAERQVAYEKEQAAIAAQAQAAKDLADQQRTWMAELQAKLTQMVQPAVQPTGQMITPKATVQQALAQVPPPAAKTPAQMATDMGLPPKDMQTLLMQRGFDPGPLDGIIGKKTQTALIRFKQSVGLPSNADITPRVIEMLRAVPPGGSFNNPGYKPEGFIGRIT